MLSHPNLIYQPPYRYETNENGPQEHTPCPQTVPDQRHNLELIRNKVSANPHGPKMKPVHRRSNKHCPRNPAMQPIQPLMASPSQKPDDVELHGQEVDERELSHADPGVSVADALPVVDVVLDGVPGHEVDGYGPVAEEEEDAAEGEGRRPAEAGDGDVELGVGEFADDGG